MPGPLIGTQALPVFKNLLLDDVGHVELVVLTPRDLGYRESPRFSDFLDTNVLGIWSLDHLVGRSIQTLPFPWEMTLELRMRYLDQPEGEILWIAMAPVRDEKVWKKEGIEIPIVYGVKHTPGPGGKRMIRNIPVHEDLLLHIDSKWVFCLRQL